MSNDIYPGDIRGLKFGVQKTPRFNTLIQSAPNFFETRIRQSQNPVWKWTLLYDYLYASANGEYNNQLLSGRDYPDYQLLLGFFLAHAGQFDDFLFLDPDDHTVGPGLIGADPNLKAELQLVTDGTLFYSPLQRNMGGMFYEDITDLVPDTLIVWNDGDELDVDVDYVVKGPGLAVPGASFGGMYLEFTSEPAQPVTAQFDFYFRVTFATDEQEFEKFLKDLWTIGGHGGSQLELRTARPVIECID